MAAAHEIIINRFYEGLQNLDARQMNACYSDNIAFFDPMFELLHGDAAKAMWRMLCKNAKDFSLEFGNIHDLGDDYYTCEWTASYTFSKTRRRVINKAKAHMKIENGQITEHSDAWSLAKWSEQAIGLSGKLFGWFGMYRRRLKNEARQNLLAFIEKEQS